MKKSDEGVVAIAFGEDFIKRLADHLLAGLSSARDLSRIAVVFGGRRPALFLNRELANRAGGSFFPPRCFSMDDFIDYTVSRSAPCGEMPDMEACHLIYRLAAAEAPEILKGRDSFAQFLPWAREIASFIERCDLDDIDAASLEAVQQGAGIGFDVPPSVNRLLCRIIAIRSAYHGELEARKRYSRGLRYLFAARRIKETEFPEFRRILFCNFFYLHRAERAVMKELYARGQALLVFQGDAREWPVLRDLEKFFSCEIRPSRRAARPPALRLWAGLDTHAQAAQVREIVKRMRRKERTVVVLPDAGSVRPVLAELSSCAREFNVSLGYPVKRSSLAGLFECVFAAQSSRRGGAYYARDYLRVMTHPLLKNMKIALDPSVSRVLVHKLEEALCGAAGLPLGGCLFFRRGEIRGLPELHRGAAATLARMGMRIDEGDLPGVLDGLHEFGFGIWEEVRDFREFAAALSRFMNALLEKSPLRGCVTNLKAAERIIAVGEELGSASFSGERFPAGEIFRIFLLRLAEENINFSGSPLKGLQVLGLYETRSLNFENVIVMDVNESVLPRLSVCEPLIPRQVMVQLGIDRVEEEEQIQRYHLSRLIAHAATVHLLYNDDPAKERSRFIEELAWEREKSEGRLGALAPRRASFRARPVLNKGEVRKSEGALRILGRFTHSPSSIDAYLGCPLGFYYRYVLRMEEKEDLLEEPAGADVGTFVHELLRDGFAPFLGGAPRIGREFRESFFGDMDRRFDERFAKRMRADSLLLKHVLRFRLDRFLDAEEERGVRKILALEDRIDGEIAAGPARAAFRCRIDRVDELSDGRIMILDYKTGSGALPPRGAAVIAMRDFSRTAVKAAVRSFQLPLYCHFAGGRYGEEEPYASLYDVRTLRIAEFPGASERGRRGEIMQKCMEALTAVLLEILDPETPFVADEEDRRRCARCPFFGLCR